MAAIIPKNFIENFRELLDEEELLEFLSACQRPLRKSIRVNTLKVSVPKFLELAKNEGWELKPIPWCSTGFWIDRESHELPLGKHYLHLAGYFYVQEASSMLPPEVLGVQEGDIVLDVAAAPGSKTTQLAALLKNTGIVVANEPETSRIKAMASNLERLGVANVLFTQKDGRAFSQYFPNFFDKILLDAPCTGEGTVRKDHTALEHWNLKKIEAMAELQWTILEQAFKALKAGGEMVYSTCTLSPEENEMVLLRLLDAFPNNAEIVAIDELFIQNPKQFGLDLEDIKIDVQGLGVDGVLRIWPHVFDTEGFFVAKIKKHIPTEIGDFIDARRDSPFSSLSQSTAAWFKKQIFQLFGEENIFKFLDQKMLWERGNEVWVRPEQAEKIAQKIALDRGGLLLFERHKNDIKITHEGALYLIQQGLVPQKGVVELSEEEVKQFHYGTDIQKNLEPQLVFVTHNGVFLGLCKALGKKLKNQLPRHFTVS